MEALHNSLQGGHFWLLLDTPASETTIFLNGDEHVAKCFMLECIICQQMKLPQSHPLGLLQLLHISKAIWSEISIDFVTTLPLVHGNSVITVVVDMLSKYCHLRSLPANYSAVSVAEYFIKHIIRLQCMQAVIMFDRNKVFVKRFWKELCNCSRNKFSIFTTYHPEIDGQTEIVNKTIKGLPSSFNT